jgi:hypothetical protein
MTLVDVPPARGSDSHQPLDIALHIGDRWLRVRRDCTYGGFDDESSEQCQPDRCTTADCRHCVYQGHLDNYPDEWERWRYQKYALQDGRANVSLLRLLYPRQCATSLMRQCQAGRYPGGPNDKRKRFR